MLRKLVVEVYGFADGPLPHELAEAFGQFPGKGTAHTSCWGGWGGGEIYCVHLIHFEIPSWTVFSFPPNMLIFFNSFAVGCLLFAQMPTAW